MLQFMIFEMQLVVTLLACRPQSAVHTSAPKASPAAISSVAQDWGFAEYSAVDFPVAIHSSGPRWVGSLDRASGWMKRYLETEDARFDAAFLLHHVRRVADSEDLKEVHEVVREQVNWDRGHPLRVLADPSFIERIPPGTSHGWSAPDEGRVNANRVLVEAAHCARDGWRDQTTTYVCGNMRDQGGFQTTHALWSLDYAVEQQCVERAQVSACLLSLQEELLAAQRSADEPASTTEMDLFIQRVIMLIRSGSVAPELEAWVIQVAHWQRADGAWGIASDEDDPYYEFHVTMMGVWAIIEWVTLQSS